MDVIWAKLKVDTDDAKKSIQSYNAEVIKSERTVKHAGDAGTIAFNKQATAIKGATDAQRNLQKESTKTGSTFSNVVNKTVSGIGNISGALGQVAAGLGLAFGTQQIVAFGKEAISTFIENEVVARKLQFAVKNLANDSEAAFNRLIAQSTKMQEISIFGDGDIQNAQTALLQYGLTTDQVEKLIPAIVDLASATGEDLATATDRVQSALGGNSKSLKDVGLQFKSTGDRTKDYQIILDGLNRKFTGATADALDTTDGKLKNLQNQFGSLKGTIGGELIPLLSNLIEGVNLFNAGDPGGGISKITDTIQVGLPFVQEIKEAYEEFAKGNFWKGLANVGETVLSILTIGFYTRVKNYFSPAAKIIGDGYTDFEKAKLRIINATDKEIQAERELLIAQGKSTEEFDKYVKSVKESQVKQTFEELLTVLEITEQQYKELTDISDKYGISARINASLIKDISKATNDELQVAFEKFNTTLGVTRTDFDDYIGKVKKIPPVQKDLGDSVKKDLIGPYDALTKSLSEATKKMLDTITLGKDALIVDRQRFEIQKEINRVQAEYNRIVGLHIPVSKENTEVNKASADSMSVLADATFKTLEPTRELPNNLDAVTAAAEETTPTIEDLSSKFEDVSRIAGALANLGESLSNAMTQIFGEAAEKNAVFAGFQKAITIATITFKSIEAVANGVAAFSSGVTSGDPVKIIGGISSIIAGVGNLIGGLIEQVNAVQIPNAPSFFHGTGDTGPGGNVDSKGGFWSILHPHEGVANAKGNRQFPGLIDAVNMGKGEDYMIKHVAGKLIQQREQDIVAEAERLLLESKNEFNDKRLYKNGQDHTYLLKQNNILLAKMLKEKHNPWKV